MLRRPISAGWLHGMDRAADLLRLVALLSIPVAGLLYSWVNALIFVIVSVIVWVPRIAALPRPVDLAIGVTWLVAAWANATGLYVTQPWVDIPIHVITPGATAACVYLLLVRVRLVPALQDRLVRRRAVVLIAFAVGTTLAVLWEFYEWVHYHGVGPPMVGYGDTILDLLMGCIGSLAAGLLLAVWATAGWGTRRIRAPRQS